VEASLALFAELPSLPDGWDGWLKLLVIGGIAGAVHLLVIGVRRGSELVLSSRITSSSAKLRTITWLLQSMAIFFLYFIAAGFALLELGVPLQGYLASASIVGLAVGFGSQGLVQDIVTGVTLVFSDLFDVGEMVDVSGQVGIVEKVGIRFTVLTNYMGARVYVPNRTIANVILYPKGYVRLFVDVQLPDDAGLEGRVEHRVRDMMTTARERFPGIFVREPSLEGTLSTTSGKRFLRAKFRIWPGQGGPLETAFKSELVQDLKQFDADYAEWMVVVSYETEEKVVSSMAVRAARKPKRERSSAKQERAAKLAPHPAKPK